MDLTMQQIMQMGRVQYKPNLRTWNYLSTKIVIVGCGGTGGRLIPTISQHIANHNRDVQMETTGKMFLKHDLELTLIDMDIVEPKNLKRQNFYAFDVGKNKAQCLAERYSALNGIDIQYFTDKFEDVSASIHGENVIIFDCTDNLDARKSIEAFRKSAVLISCGNEDTFGQVIVSNTNNSPEEHMIRQMGQCYDVVQSVLNGTQDHSKTVKKVDYLPTLLNMHPTFKDTETASCTEIEIVNEQSMPINSLVAQLAYNVFYDIVSGVPLKYHMVKCSVENSFTTTFVNSPLSYLELIFNTLVQTAPFSMDEAAKLRQFTNDYDFETWKYRQRSATEIIAKIESTKYKTIAPAVASYYITNKQNRPCSAGMAKNADSEVQELFAYRKSLLEG